MSDDVHVRTPMLAAPDSADTRRVDTPLTRHVTPPAAQRGVTPPTNESSGRRTFKLFERANDKWYA
jgi:hypothetical protein